MTTVMNPSTTAMEVDYSGDRIRTPSNCGATHYSARSAPAGEIPLARNAGTTDATSAANPSTTTDTAATPKL